MMSVLHRVLVLGLLAIGLLSFLPIDMAAQGRESEHVHDGFTCGGLPHGPGLAPGEQGLVDRFNNPWRPSPLLIEAAKRRARTLSAGCGFRVDFEDEILGTGKGFDDHTPIVHPILGNTTLGELRRRTVCEVFDYLASIIEIDVVPDIIVQRSQTDGSGFLAAAGPFFRSAAAGTFKGGTLYEHITTGADPTPEPGSYDAMVIYDFGPWIVDGRERPINSDWNEPSNGRLDLFSITLHELTHALGFLSLIAPGGASGIGGAYSLFDIRLRNGQGEPLVDPATAKFIAAPADLLSNQVYFQGTRCGTQSPVYSPANFAPGSSLSHFDAYRSGVRYVMRYATGGGDDRALTDEELHTLCDIGYRMRNGICGRCRPIGNVDTASTFPGVEVCVDVLANDYDPDGGVLSIDPASVRIASGGGDVVIRNGEICYTPPVEFTGTAFIEYVPVNAGGPGDKTLLKVWVRRDRRNVHGLDSGLVAYWPFDDSTATDASGNGHHGNLFGGPVAVPGVCGSGISFDGVDDYIRVPATPMLGALKQMTLCYWIKFHHPSDINIAGNSIGNGSDDKPREPGFYTYTGSTEISHFLGLQPNGRGIRLPYDATVPLDQQEYIFVTFRVTYDSMSVYRNGCLVATISRDGWPIARDYDWFMGWSGDYSGDSKFLEGMMDEVRLYDRPLSHQEIIEIYALCGGKRGIDVDREDLSFDFLRCPRRDSTITIPVHNRTKDQLVMTAWLSSGKEFTLDLGVVGLLDPGAEAPVKVRFHPDGDGFFTDTLFVMGDCTGPVAIPLVGGKEKCGDDPGSGTDLVVTKTVSDSTPVVGTKVSYSIGVANNGPSDATLVVVRDLLPVGLHLVSYATTGPVATYDPSTGDLEIPLLAVGDVVRLMVVALVDSSAPATVVNCAELVDMTNGIEKGDLNFTNNTACATIAPRLCGVGVHGTARIGLNYRAIPGAAVRIPVELRDPMDEAAITRIRISLSFDPSVVQPIGWNNIADLTRGTLLDGWQLVRADILRGTVSVELQAPAPDDFIRGAGILIDPLFRVYVGEESGSDLALTVELPGHLCDSVSATAGYVRADSVCGLNLRLIEASPESYALDPNSPNPFNPTTEIGFSVGLDGRTRLVVLNSLGKEVAVLVDDHLRPGRYSVVWDASAEPSGLYYYRLESGTWSMTRSMMLVK